MRFSSRIEARHHPQADVAALLVRNVAPGVAAGLVGLRDRARAPELFARLRVERREHAGLGAAFGLAAAARDHLAVRDDRARAVLRAVAVVEDLRFPRELARARVERVRVVVGAVVEDQVAVDREIAVDRRERDVVVVVVLHGPAVFPDQVAGRSVDGLRDVVRVRKEHHAVVHERRAFLHALRERPRPHEPQLRDVALRSPARAGCSPSDSACGATTASRAASGFCSIASVTGRKLRCCAGCCAAAVVQVRAPSSAAQSVVVFIAVSRMRELRSDQAFWVAGLPTTWSACRGRRRSGTSA